MLLEPESAGRRSPDCRINERIFEIKQITRTKNIHQSLIRQLRTSYFKANRVLIHICQPANLKQLEGGLAEATHKYKKMEEIWIVKDGAFFTWEFATKKLRRAAP